MGPHEWLALSLIAAVFAPDLLDVAVAAGVGARLLLARGRHRPGRVDNPHRAIRLHR
jgi:hypothetical protein